MDDDFLVEDAVERRLVHRAGERAEAAVAEAVEGGQVGVADGHARQAGGAGAEGVGFGGRDVAVDGFAQAAVRRDQIGHSGSPQIW